MSNALPDLAVNQPPDNLTVQLNRPFLVAGHTSIQGTPDGPRTIDSVTVQVDGGTPIDANPTLISSKKNLATYNFGTFASVTGGQDPHTVTVTATDDQGVSVTKIVSVFTGPVFEVDSPAVLIDIVTGFDVTIDPNDQKILALISKIQQALMPLSATLASLGKVLAGPNLFATTDPHGNPVLRFGLWIEDPSFPVSPPQPPAFPLPRLSDQAAQAGFSTVPFLPVPSPVLGPAFALSIPLRTLQNLLDAAAPTLKAAASQQGVSLNSITVIATSPGSVTTSFVGSLPPDVPFAISITETLGVKPLPNAQPPQSVPALIGSSSSTGVGNVWDWLLGLFMPLVDIALLTAFGLASSAAGAAAEQISGIMGPLLAGLPPRIPFGNMDLPSSVPLPDFPTLVLNWKFFGVDDSSNIFGQGTTTLLARDQTTVALSISGLTHIQGVQEEMAGGALQSYGYTLFDLAPDPDKFSWQVFGTGSDAGTIDRGPFDQSGSVNVDFPLPLNVKLGKFPFTLAADATETCESDPTKKLTASSTTQVEVEVLKNPVVPR